MDKLMVRFQEISIGELRGEFGHVNAAPFLGAVLY
jgi:hypothetical protein